jgi:fluoroquinolone transport system permease protein
VENNTFNVKNNAKNNTKNNMKNSMKSSMKKYLSLLKYEAKTIVRDPINIYMCLFPIVMLLLASFVFPMIFESIDPMQGTILKATMLLLLITILAFGSFFLAAMATFLLLEHKDEHTLYTIAVTPTEISGYLKFKMAYIYLMSVAGNIAVLLGIKLIAGDKYTVLGMSLFDNIDILDIITFTIANGIFTPALGLLQAAYAKNKVEGFAFIKGTGILALVPALMILETFQGGLQYVLGIFPNFWAIRGMLLKFVPIENTADLSYSMYLLIGGVYNMILLAAAYRLFLKKAQY